MMFETYFWKPLSIKNPELREYTVNFLSGQLTAEALETTLDYLLDHPQIIGRGVVWDSYHRIEALSRHGLINKLEVRKEKILKLARLELDQEPTPKAGGARFVGANYTSALGALIMLGEIEDIEKVFLFFEGNYPPDTKSFAAYAIINILHRSQEPPISLIPRLLENLVNPKVDLGHKDIIKRGLFAYSQSAFEHLLSSDFDTIPIDYQSCLGKILWKKNPTKFENFLKKLTTHWAGKPDLILTKDQQRLLAWSRTLEAN